MKPKFILFALSICLLNCNTESKPKLEYTFVTGEPSLNCEQADAKLFEEALRSFEDDLIKFYTPDQPNLSKAYSQYMRAAIGNRVSYNDVISEHSRDVYKALEAKKPLWHATEKRQELNFNHPIFKCIGDNMKNSDLRKTYNALTSTNSMSMRMIGYELQRKAYTLKDDPYASTFAALITYYDHFKDVDFTQPKTPPTENAKQPSRAEKAGSDSHEGHGH